MIHLPSFSRNGRAIRAARKPKASGRTPRRFTESKFRSLVEESRVGVFLWQERIQYANPCLEGLLGYTLEELTQLESVDLFYPDAGSTHEEKVNDFFLQIVSGKPFQWRLKRKDGTPLDIEGLATQTVFQGKTAFTGTVIDVTELKQTELLLRESDQRYRTLMKLLPEPIIVHSEGIVVYANDAAISQLGGGNQETLLGQDLFERIHPEDQAGFRHAMSRLYQGENPSAPVTREIRVYSSDGGMLEVDSRSVLFNNYLDKAVIQSVFRDVTERKRTEELLIKQEELSVVGQLAAGIAHEIRNPLTSLKGFTQLLKGKYPNESTYFDIMLTELDRINHIVSELMTVAKPQTVQFRPMEVTTILGSVIQLLESQAILNNIRIRVDCSLASRAIVHCDGNQLKQVFINILKNAMEAMPGGGIIQVKLAEEQDRKLQIRFTDEGIGIPPEKLRMLGDPFFTTKPHGNGLGLMVCFKMIEAHHGSITIESSPNEGTTVDISLPLAELEGEN